MSSMYRRLPHLIAIKPHPIAEQGPLRKQMYQCIVFSPLVLIVRGPRRPGIILRCICVKTVEGRSGSC
jgi:hypothetical protein